ncbi:MAG: ADP-ribosylglycohydrolase family protein [Desulfotomaculaceae bacterium]|nr:ADP-ribosylglycohydrolase family protein [Desulfotomaculaceae bacterium]
MYDKIQGSLFGAAVGSALGAATAIRSMEQIQEKFHGFVTNFFQPPDDTFARGQEAGAVSGDFYHTYLLAKHLVAAGGQAYEKIGQDALLAWAEQPKWFEHFADPTTRNVVKKLTSSILPPRHRLYMSHYFALSANGSAVKIFPVGLMRPGQIQQALADAIVVTMTVYNDAYSISGACAIAAAVSEAMRPQSKLYDVVQAGLYGAREGERRGREIARQYPGPSVWKRIEMAIEIGLRSGSAQSKMAKLADCIGSGIAVAEAVPAVFGLLVANGGNTMNSIYGGVNVGNDTPAVATMLGAITGALHGVDSVKAEYRRVIMEKNQLDIPGLARDMLALIEK